MRLEVTGEGPYVLAGTTNGKVFVWNATTGGLVAVFADHMPHRGTPQRGTAGGTVRHIVAHPYLPFLFTASEDGDVNIYHPSHQARPSPLPSRHYKDIPNGTANRTVSDLQQNDDSDEDLEAITAEAQDTAIIALPPKRKRGRPPNPNKSKRE